MTLCTYTQGSHASTIRSISTYIHRYFKSLRNLCVVCVCVCVCAHARAPMEISICTQVFGDLKPSLIDVTTQYLERDRSHRMKAWACHNVVGCRRLACNSHFDNVTISFFGGHVCIKTQSVNIAHMFPLSFMYHIQKTLRQLISDLEYFFIKK